MEQNATLAALDDFVSSSLLDNAEACLQTYNPTPSNFTLHFRATKTKKQRQTIKIYNKEGKKQRNLRFYKEEFNETISSKKTINIEAKDIKFFI